MAESATARVAAWLDDACPGWAQAQFGAVLVYRVFADDGTLLYIGSTIGLTTRFIRHGTHSAWFPEARRVTLERFSTLAAAKAAETAAIAAEQPPHNRVGTPRDGRLRANRIARAG